MGKSEVRDITVNREDGVDIEFIDGHRCTFDLEELRLACPCASCRGARDKGQAPWPTPRSPQPLTITDAELVGAWGLSITWNDGHSTGIYPWDSLRRWCEQGRPVYPPDSGLGGVGGSPPEGT
ncbi:MAG: DUF971 domain-containing protein [Acidimicrobiales bacterium]